MECMTENMAAFNAKIFSRTFISESIPVRFEVSAPGPPREGLRGQGATARGAAAGFGGDHRLRALSSVNLRLLVSLEKYSS